jgi:hypothetical protein
MKFDVYEPTRLGVQADPVALEADSVTVTECGHLKFWAAEDEKRYCPLIAAFAPGRWAKFIRHVEGGEV